MQASPKITIETKPTSGGTLDNPFMFTGQYCDSEIDQYYLRARQYDPLLARFTARDPVLGEFKEPLTLHTYLYCINDPVNRVDLGGEFSYTETLTTAAIWTQRAWSTYSFASQVYEHAQQIHDLASFRDAMIDLAVEGAIHYGTSKAFGYALKGMGRLGGKAAKGLAKRLGKFRISKFDTDWATKGFHITTSKGVELAVRPGTGGSIVFKAVHSSASKSAVAAAIKEAEGCIDDPDVLLLMYDRAIKGRDYVKGLGAVAKSGELHFLVKAIEKRLGI